MKRRTFMANVSAAAGGAAAYALTPGFPAILSAQSAGPGPVVETTSQGTSFNLSSEGA